jgi:hypothetical protein
MSPVHPHIHGEYVVTITEVQAIERFTPTYMGNTLASLVIWAASEIMALLWSIVAWVAASVHPHIHGEYELGLPLRAFNTGSPPHTWGILYNFTANR